MKLNKLAAQMVKQLAEVHTVNEVNRVTEFLEEVHKAGSLIFLPEIGSGFRKTVKELEKQYTIPVNISAKKGITDPVQPVMRYGEGLYIFHSGGYSRYAKTLEGYKPLSEVKELYEVLGLLDGYELAGYALPILPKIKGKVEHPTAYKVDKLTTLAEIRANFFKVKQVITAEVDYNRNYSQEYHSKEENEAEELTVKFTIDERETGSALGLYEVHPDELTSLGIEHKFTEPFTVYPAEFYLANTEEDEYVDAMLYRSALISLPLLNSNDFALLLDRLYVNPYGDYIDRYDLEALTVSNVRTSGANYVKRNTQLRLLPELIGNKGKYTGRQLNVAPHRITAGTYLRYLDPSKSLDGVDLTEYDSHHIIGFTAEVSDITGFTNSAANLMLLPKADHTGYHKQARQLNRGEITPEEVHPLTLIASIDEKTKEKTKREEKNNQQ